MAESEEDLKSLLMRVKKESERASLKPNNKKNQYHGIQSHHFMANRKGKSDSSDRFLFSCSPKSLQTMSAAMEFKNTCSLEGKL